MNHLFQSLQRSRRALADTDIAKAAIGLICLFVGACVLTGWWFEIEALTRLRPTWVGMNPLTAISFMMTGSVLVLHALRRHRAVIVLGAALGVIALLKIVDLLSGATPVDTLLFTAQLVSPNAAPNRMAPNTAIAFGLVSISVMASFGTRERAMQISQSCAFGVLLIAIFALIGYAFGISGLTRIGAFIPMALHTGTCLLLVSIGLLCLQPDRGLTAIIRHPGPAGEMARKVLPLAIMIPILVGGLRLWGRTRAITGPRPGSRCKWWQTSR